MFAFLVLCCSLAGAQQRLQHRVTGKVTHEGQGVADVHVMNLSARTATISDESGAFALHAGLNDTLLFSGVQFRRKTLLVTIAILESPLILVPLEEFVNQLDEVVLRPFNLSGDLGSDLGNTAPDKVYVASSLGLPNAYVKPPTQAERKLFEATSGSGLVPLNPVLNAITGRTRYLKELVKTESTYARTMRVRNFYPDSLYIRELRIPEAKIPDFMYFCEVDPRFSSLVDSRDRLRIWEFMKEKSKDYRLNNHLE